MSGLAALASPGEADGANASTSCTGVIEVLAANGDPQGYLAFADDYYSVVADAAAASQVRIGGGEQENIEDLGAPAETPAIGLVSGNNGTTLAPGARGYVWLARSAVTAPAATPQAVPHTSPFGSRGLSETAVWHVDRRTRDLVPSWVNDDGAPGQPTSPFSYGYSSPIVGTTGDLGQFQRTASQPSAPVGLRLAADTTGCLGTAQAITFGSTAPSTAYVGSTYAASATSDSGDDVALSTLTPDVCSFDLGTYTFLKAGTCTVAADQDGDDTYAPAPQVTQSITVQKVPTTVAVFPDHAVISGQQTSLLATVELPQGVSGDVPAGAVQFAVDGVDLGAPVAVGTTTPPSSGGRASSPTFSPRAGDHDVTATFVPTDDTTYAASSVTSTQGVAKAVTTTKVAVTAKHLVATVGSQLAGTTAPAGAVSFKVAGVEVGQAPVVNGKAVLDHAVAAGQSRAVSAQYLGDDETLGSTDSVTRNDPFLTAETSSTSPRSAAGWWRAPVRIHYTCTPHGAELVDACPADEDLTREGAGQSVTRTVSAVDGGVSSTTTTANIDLTAPKVALTGVKAGQRYFAKAPAARCVASDALSGLASCRVTTTAGRNGARTVTATATDRAGNVARTSASYVVVRQAVAGATYRNGAWEVRRGHGYTVQAQSAARPTLRLASTSTAGLAKAATRAMARTGRDTWKIAVALSTPRTRDHTCYLGIQQGRTITPVKVRVVG